MSQRGSLRNGAAKKCPARRWGYIRKALCCSLVFILTLSIPLTLFAQDSQHVKMVTVQVDGALQQVNATQDTVQALLRQLSIHLSPDDRCEPSLLTTLTDGMKVKITRITHETVIRQLEQPSPVEVRKDSSLYSVANAIHPGHPGLVEETTVVWKKDGVAAISWVESTRVVRAATPTVILRGVMPSRAGVRRVLDVVATAYDPGPLSCGSNCTGRTAMGLKAGRGVIAVDPRVIPLGSRVFIEGYGPAIAADTGGAIKGNRIDVCFNTRGEALRWGRHTVKILIY